MAVTLLGTKDQSAPAAGNSDLIKETTTQGFVKDVIEASQDVPVLVDFWAPWCGPCKQLTPLLEKAVKAANGAIKLVKMNIDEHPAIAGQLGVQSVPAVFAFKAGRPVDGFMGALPESQIRSFIERIAGKDVFAGSVLEAAREALDAGDINSAAEGFAAALQQDSGNADAVAGLARCYIMTGDLKRAEQTLALTPPSKQNSAAITSAKAALDVARKGEASAKTDVGALLSAIAKDPANFHARLDLALALNIKGDPEGAMEQLLEVIKRDRSWNDDAARKQLVEFFNAWGPAHPLSISGRQRLSSLLFA